MKNKFIIIDICLLISINYLCLSQELNKSATDTLNISGQISAWGGYNSENPLPVITGGRYIPSAYYGIRPQAGRLFDLEVSANIYGSRMFDNKSRSSLKNRDFCIKRQWDRE